ncbi:MAG: LacI family DNA-binding transcriptional regulator, partial [Lentisphaeria bacterium]|nr:LacI family DNA-binding transcriptional regulator [Lentisphaeria bacterium]
MRIRKAPKTENVYLLLKERITGDGFPGDILPMEPELAEQLGVSRNTVRSALARLTLENYIVRIKGQGTFVNRSAGEDARILVMVRDEEGITTPDRYILPGIQQEAAAMNLQVDTCTCLSLTAGSPEAAVRRIMDKNYRGIISMESNFNGTEPIIDILKRTGLPVLLPHAMPHDAENTPFAVMGTDYHQVMRDALQYLAGLGHRRIAYLAYSELRIARKDYFRLLEELGPDRDPKLYFDSPSYRDHDVIVSSIEKMFAGCRKQPSAVLCFSDYFALCLYEYLQAKHLSIPE